MEYHALPQEEEAVVDEMMEEVLTDSAVPIDGNYSVVEGEEEPYVEETEDTGDLFCIDTAMDDEGLEDDCAIFIEDGDGDAEVAIGELIAEERLGVTDGYTEMCPMEATPIEELELGAGDSVVEDEAAVDQIVSEPALAVESLGEPIGEEAQDTEGIMLEVVDEDCPPEEVDALADNSAAGLQLEVEATISGEALGLDNEGGIAESGDVEGYGDIALEAEAVDTPAEPACDFVDEGMHLEDDAAEAESVDVTIKQASGLVAEEGVVAESIVETEGDVAVATQSPERGMLPEENQATVGTTPLTTREFPPVKATPKGPPGNDFSKVTPLPVARSANGTAAPKAPTHPQAGYVFVCGNSTEKECESLRLFGSPRYELSKMKRCITPDSTLFLLNFNTSKLIGTFAASGTPDHDVVPEAFGGKFNAQVPVLPLEAPLREAKLERRIPSGPKSVEEVEDLKARLVQGTVCARAVQEAWGAEVEISEPPSKKAKITEHVVNLEDYTVDGEGAEEVQVVKAVVQDSGVQDGGAALDVDEDGTPKEAEDDVDGPPPQPIFTAPRPKFSAPRPKWAGNSQPTLMMPQSAVKPPPAQRPKLVLPSAALMASPKIRAFTPTGFTPPGLSVSPKGFQVVSPRNIFHASPGAGGQSPWSGMPSKDNGYVFQCSNSTQQECESLQIFGGPDRDFAAMKRCITTGTWIFLMNFETLKMFGPFVAASEAQFRIVPGSFQGRFNAQVRVQPAEGTVHEVLLQNKLPGGPRTPEEVEGLRALLTQGDATPVNPQVQQAWDSPANDKPLALQRMPSVEAPLGAFDAEGRRYNLSQIVVNFANVGASYASKVLNKDNKRGDRLFDWEGVRKCVKHLTQERHLRVVGVVFENLWGPDNGRKDTNGIPQDIRAMCSSIQETPKLTGRNQKSADDEMTIKCAYKRNCRFMDNDNYRDWLQEMRDDRCRRWLQDKQEMLQMRYFFDSELGEFDTLDGNIPMGLLEKGTRQPVPAHLVGKIS